MPEKCCCFTGHRPDGIGGYDESCDARVWVRNALARAVDVAIGLGYTRFVTGGALGVDTDAAEVVLLKRGALLTEPGSARISLTVSAPYQGFNSKWRKESIGRFYAIAERADKLIWVSKETTYSPRLLHQRNEFMVDHSELVIAVWNGSQRGGTFSCVDYAKNNGRTIVRIDPVERRTYTMKY